MVNGEETEAAFADGFEDDRRQFAALVVSLDSLDASVV
jgi:hypothetical protein